MAMDMRGLQRGTLVHNRYRIRSVLGAGGFGVTYLVEDVKTRKISAMKEYMPRDIAYRSPGSTEVRPLSESTREQYQKFHQQFYREAQAIFNLRGHPNIVEINDLFYENNTVYYVMEYVEGMDLRQVLKKNGGRLSWDALRPILQQVVTGLSHVHSSGMIHCDISPDNIFLVNGGKIKLLDFGAARSTLRGSVETSVIVAKPGFAPVEQMRGRNLGTWTDVYALAVTIYHCVTGRMVPDSTERMINDKTIWPSQMGIVIPSGNWEAALKKAMAIRVEDRYSTVAEFWTAMTGGMPQSSRQQPQPQPRLQSQPISNQGQRGNLELRGIRGVYANRMILVSREFNLGVDPSRCQITFPVGTPGVSRLHLRIWPERGGIMAMDMGSTYGTIVNGRKLSPGIACQLSPGSTVELGGGEVFRVM